MIYNSCVLPYLTYCVELWGNTCSSDIKPIKLMQKSCFRIICNAYYLAHSRLLAKILNTLFINNIWYVQVACLMYKVINRDICNCICIMFQMFFYRHTHNSNFNFYVYSISVNARKLFVVHAAIMLWNNLHVNLKKCKSVRIFCNHIKSLKLSDYI